ncbi:MAG: ATP-binding protein [Gemmatimonadales bacterium]
MDSLIWILVLAGGAGLIAVGVLVWAVGSVHRDRERSAIDWGRRVLAAQDEERRSIARELHDSVVPELIDLDLALVGTASGGGAASRIAERLRNISRLMHPGVVDHLTLDQALRHLTTAADWSFVVLLKADDTEGLADDAKLAGYRIAQEALTNVRRHAEATRVGVTVRATEREVVMTIQDDGTGFEVPAANTLASLGLRSMQERALAAGGRFTVVSAPGAGTTITVAFPRDSA